MIGLSICGPEFCNQLGDYTGFRHVETTGSGTDALYKILISIDVKGQDVLLPNYICSDVYFSVVYFLVVY